MKTTKLILLSILTLTASAATHISAQNAAPQAPVFQSLKGKKYNVAEDLSMHHFFSAVVARDYLIEAFSTSPTQYDARHIRVFLVRSEGALGERTVVDELEIDRATDDSFSYIPVYDRRSDSKKEYFARYSIDGGEIRLKELYEFDPDSKTIITRQPVPGMRVELDDY
ncbi:MAG: hypothetical protein LBI58_03245 [Tannerellaceae bacterium]|jgi:hypothetical protein|nr:hypothetical protein [Tannerellaceae bacterium]